MRWTAALALAASAIAGAAVGQAWPGAPPKGADVEAAVARLRDGGLQTLVRLADSGRADAQTAVAPYFIFGAAGAPKDGAKACAYVQKASATRSDAMHLLGECYQYGYGGEKDLEKAVAAFRKAGDMGLPKSRCAEGNVLIELGRDQMRAVELCREGAEAGDPDAQTDLANFYLQGEIVPRDMAIARAWYEKAATQKQANAAFVLGQIYWNGDGVTRDRARAAELWRLAYAGGREDAAFHLGNEAFLRASRGSGVWDPDGLLEAHDWYAKAASARNPEIARAAQEQRDLTAQLVGVMRRRR